MTRSTLVAALGTALLLATLPLIAGCDTGTPGPIIDDTGVRVSTFTPRANQFGLNADGDIATFERNTQQLTPAIVQGGVVLLYAQGHLILAGAGDTWTALPYTQGVEWEGPDFPYVDFTITYSYSFEAGWLYLDVITSAPGLFFEDWAFDAYVPDDVAFRLVTIPPGINMIPGVDYSSYDAVIDAHGVRE